MMNLIDFLNRLERAKIYYKLNKVNDEFIMVEVAVPGQRWEVEFSDSEIQIEKFLSDGSIYNESEIEVLFNDFSA